MPGFKPVKEPIREVTAPQPRAPGHNPVLDKIRKRLGHLTLDWEPQNWLDTGNVDLNQVLGHPEKGIPYGRISEVSGFESQGKTAVCLALAGMAQKQGAGVVWIDAESSYDPEWAARRGLVEDKSLIVVDQYLGNFGKEKTPRLATAEELCQQGEEALKILHGKHDRLVLVVDSIASMLTKDEAQAGLESNMRTRLALAMFLGTLLRRWVGLAQSYNCMILLVNQLRENPMAKFQDPLYTPGGNAPRFYSHIRARVRRAKGGKLLQKGKLVGIQGVITNMKNKAGGEERHAVGFKLVFKKDLQFVTAESLEKADV